MRVALPLILLTAALPLAACSGGEKAHVSNATADLSQLRNFTSVALTGPDDVVITVGPEFSVKAEGEAKVLEKLEFSVDDGKLKIGRKSNFWGTSSDHGAVIRISMPAIAAASLTGSGDLSVDKVQGENFEMSLTGSGDMKIGALSAKSLDAVIAGSGDMTVAGASDRAEVSVTGSGNFQASSFKTNNAKVDVTGSGNAAFASDGSVSASILGSGDIAVKGKAKCKSSVMGSGELRCGA